MKKGKYTEEQIIDVLKRMEAGQKACELARELGVSEERQPSRRWGSLWLSIKFRPESTATKRFVTVLASDVHLLRPWSLAARGISSLARQRRKHPAFHREDSTGCLAAQNG